MKRSSTIFLQVDLVLIGLGALALWLWGPSARCASSTAPRLMTAGLIPILSDLINTSFC